MNNHNYYKVTIFEDIERSFPSINNHKEIYFIKKENAINELNKRFELAKDHFERYSMGQDGELSIEKDEESFHIYDECSTIIGMVSQIDFKDKEV